MRLRVELFNAGQTRLPLDHLDRLQGAVYGLLETSDQDFSRSLHDGGYAVDGGAKRFKLFVYSTIRVPRARRSIVKDELQIERGPMEWFISSPVEEFLKHLATGLLAEGAVRVGAATFSICGVEALPRPSFGERETFTCLTPVVAGVARPDGGTEYLRPRDEERFSAAVRSNLLLKHRLVHGAAPADDRLSLAFDRTYLDRDRHEGTKKTRFKTIDVIGAQAPFTLSGSAELIRVAWECGAGEKNSAGFGMIDRLTKLDSGS